MSLVASNNECPLVKELSNCLKENSRSGIVSCLTRIKTDQKCSQKVMENGGVCLLVELLRYRNTKVMDTTLSILANACLISRVREKVCSFSLYFFLFISLDYVIRFSVFFSKIGAFSVIVLFFCLTTFGPNFSLQRQGKANKVMEKMNTIWWKQC